MEKKIRIGTRGSQLALWQAYDLQSKLEAHNYTSELVIIKTQGDRIQDLSFDKLEGKGFFTKEIEESLISEDVDIAVHSLKDLPSQQPDGLVLAGLSERANPSDLLIISPKAIDSNQILGLKESAIIGTSSIRRKVQITHLAPHITTKDLRGNVPTRINKLREGQYDAIILASAGVERLELDLSDLVTTQLNVREFIPAPAQGVIAYQCREKDLNTRRIIQLFHNKETALCSNQERKVLKLLDAGCQTPLGIHCIRDHVGNYHLYGAYGKSDGKLLKSRLSQNTSYNLAEKMVNQLKA